MQEYWTKSFKMLNETCDMKCGKFLLPMKQMPVESFFVATFQSPAFAAISRTRAFSMPPV